MGRMGADVVGEAAEKEVRSPTSVAGAALSEKAQVPAEELCQVEMGQQEVNYIGRALVGVADFILEYSVEDPEIGRLVDDLLSELDASELKNDGLAAPTIAISKTELTLLIRLLRQL